MMMNDERIATNHQYWVGYLPSWLYVNKMAVFLYFNSGKFSWGIRSQRRFFVDKPLYQSDCSSF